MLCLPSTSPSGSPNDETAFLWVDDIENLLERLTECLSQTLQVTERFWLDSHKIRSLSASGHTTCHQFPEDLGTTLKELKNANYHLEKMAKSCRKIAERVSILLQFENIELCDLRIRAHSGA